MLRRSRLFYRKIIDALFFLKKSYARVEFVLSDDVIENIEFRSVDNYRKQYTLAMQHHTLLSAMTRSRKQASRKHRKLSLLSFLPLFAAFVVTMLIVPISLFAKVGSDSLPAQDSIYSYFVKEIGSSTPLMAKDIDRQVAPASLTKILTCIIAIESGKLNNDVIITKESTMVEPSKAGFQAGDHIKLIDLVRAAMVSSSNDAAFAIAIYLGGNVESFVAAMNNKARMIGMRHSYFTNPAGFDHGAFAGNISTAGDLMRLTEYSVQNPTFNQVARLEKVVIAEQLTGKVYWLRTHNKMLDRYPYTVGIKTGYTRKAGGCLIARAIKNDKDVLLVMMNARNRWDIASNMFDTAFAAGTPAPFVVASTRASASNPALALKESEQPKTPTLTPKVRDKSANRSLALADKPLVEKRKERARLKDDTKANKKLKKQALAESKNNKRSKKESLAELKKNKKLKKQAVAESKKNKKSKKESLAELKKSKQSKKQVLTESKKNKQSKKESLAELRKSNKAKKRELTNSKQKKRELAASKSLKKSKKREEQS